MPKQINKQIAVEYKTEKGEKENGEETRHDETWLDIIEEWYGVKMREREIDIYIYVWWNTTTKTKTK